MKAVLLTVLLMLIPMLAAAQNVATQLTATEAFDPYNLLGNGAVGDFASLGTLNCPGTQPTGNPIQPCPSGSRINLRGLSGKSAMISESPLLSGWFSWEMNANFDANGAGHAWGTFRLELLAGGVWEGSWTNDRNFVEIMWSGRGRFVGRGTSGSVEGMQLRFTEVASTFSLLPLFWGGVIDAEVLAPPSR